MKLARLIEALSDVSAYESRLSKVEVRQTHISVVFLAGAYAYKIKKPVKFGFVDFSTLERRRHFCLEEVRLNQRLAPGNYYGVVPIVRHGDTVRVEGEGDVLEWAVKMARLADEDTLERQLARGKVDNALVAELGRQIASFHRDAERGVRIAAFGRFDAVAENIRETITDPAVEKAIIPEVLGRLRRLFDELLERSRELIESRVLHGIPCDTHGDLRLEHVYLAPATTQRSFSIIDCIEFNERFRYADPIADMAFLVMDFKFHGRRDLSAAFADSYFLAAGEENGRRLLPLYTSYRALVRAKVDALQASEPEVPMAQRTQALSRARAYGLLALSELEQVDQRPTLVLVGGLPGTGKSTLAAQLANRANFVLIRSDEVRKELAGVLPGTCKGAEFEKGIYTSAWTERTYQECVRRAEELLCRGKRVLIDATFREQAARQKCLDLAVRRGIPVAFLVCKADQAVVRERLLNRRHDVSDADWSVYLQTEQRWESLDGAAQQLSHEIETDIPLEEAVRQAIDVLMREEV